MESDTEKPTPMTRDDVVAWVREHASEVTQEYKPQEGKLIKFSLDLYNEIQRRA